MSPAAAADFRHVALLYEDEAEYLDATVPFIADGVRNGEPTMVAVDPDKIAKLRARLGSAADAVHFVDMRELGRNPARIIPAWQRFANSRPTRGTPLRGIGEPIWAGRENADLVECQLHEALLNVAFADAHDFELLCPYDTSRLDPAVIHEACCSHPFVGADPSDAYRGDDQVLAPFDGPLPTPPARAEVLAFDHRSLAQVRRLVRTRAQAAGLSDDRIDDLAVAVNEIATNSARYGGGNGVLRVWEQDGAVVCEVRDRGRIEDRLVGRRMPQPDQLGGWGVWIANQVCELVQIRSQPDGTSVRLHVLLSG